MSDTATQSIAFPSLFSKPVCVAFDERTMSPYHWGLVDVWFDPESPQRIVDTRNAHVCCASDASILAWR
jgi:hypothetical protein